MTQVTEPSNVQVPSLRSPMPSLSHRPQRLFQLPNLPPLLSTLDQASNSRGTRGLALHPPAQSINTRELAHVGESVFMNGCEALPVSRPRLNQRWAWVLTGMLT